MHMNGVINHHCQSYKLIKLYNVFPVMDWLVPNGEFDYRTPSEAVFPYMNNLIGFHLFHRKKTFRMAFMTAG